MNDNNINNSVLISNMISFDHIINNKISKTFRKSDNIMYGFLNYDKDYLSKDDMQTGLFRSVIFSYPERKVISFCPAKSISYQYFKEIFPSLNKDMQISSFVDGIMVQLFYDARVEKWKLATKYNMDGIEVPSKYYKKNIYQLFMMSLRMYENDSLESVYFIKELPKTCNYVFRLVIKNEQYNLYLNSVFQIHCNLPNAIKYVPEFEYKTWKCFQKLKFVQFPQLHYFESYYDLNEYLEYVHEPVKFIITNTKTGLRTKIESDEQVVFDKSKLVTNFEKYLFFCLHRIHSDYKICEMYPQYYKEMWNMRILFELMIDNVHQSYIDFFIKKKSLELKEPFKKYLLDIHKHIYLPSLKTRQPILIKRKMIKEYFLQLSPNELTNIFINL